MLQKLKSASLKKVLPGVIIMFLISAGLLIYFGPDFITWAKGPVVFEDLTIDEIEDQYVTMTFELTWGTYATQVTTTTRNGAKVSEWDSMQYHAVLVGGLDRYLYSEEDLYWEFIGLALPAKYFDTAKIIDRNSDDFFENYDLRALDTTLQVTGQICPMEDDMLRYYRSFFRDADYTDEEFAAYCAPYYIKVDGLKRGSVGVVLLMNAVAACLFVIALFMLIKALTGGYQKKLVKALKALGEMELERADSDYETASEPTKGLRIGRNYLFDCTSAKTEVYPLRQVAWAYIHQIDHKKYGRTVGTTYSVMLYTEDKKQHSLAVPGKSACDQVIDELSRKCPAGIFGYSDQLKQLFNKNYDEFTRLRRQKEAEVNQAQGFTDTFSADPNQNQSPYV